MSESYVILVDDTANAGKKVRVVLNTVSAQNVTQQVVTLAKSDGTLLDGNGTALPMGGDAAAAGADAGYPVKIGGVYNTSLPTYTNGQRGNIQIDAGGRILVVGSGDVASAATDSGNPVKIGGVYSTAPPTLTNGQRGNLLLDVNGRALAACSGDVAAAATDSGNPVKVGALYTTTLPAYTTGQRSQLQTDEEGKLKVAALQAGVPAVLSASVSAAQNNQTIPATPNKFSYLSGFWVGGLGATGASTIAITVTGVQNTLNFNLSIPAGATVAVTPLSVTFNPPLRSSAVNTAIVVTIPTYGAGNTTAIANAWGYVA